jgi:hypothetical protein
MYIEMNSRSEDPRHKWLVHKLVHDYDTFDSLTADGLDSAIIGVADLNGQHVAVYSTSKVIKCLMDDGMSMDEATEFFLFNIEQCHLGDGTPLFIDDEGLDNACA